MDADVLWEGRGRGLRPSQWLTLGLLGALVCWLAWDLLRPGTRPYLPAVPYLGACLIGLAYVFAWFRSVRYEIRSDAICVYHGVLFQHGKAWCRRPSERVELHGRNLHVGWGNSDPASLRSSLVLWKLDSPQAALEICRASKPECFRSSHYKPPHFPLSGCLPWAVPAALAGLLVFSGPIAALFDTGRTETARWDRLDESTAVLVFSSAGGPGRVHWTKDPRAVVGPTVRCLEVVFEASRPLFRDVYSARMKLRVPPEMQTLPLRFSNGDGVRVAEGQSVSQDYKRQ